MKLACPQETDLQRYTGDEARRVLEHFGGRVIIDTGGNGDVAAPTHPQGYAMRFVPDQGGQSVIVGTDDHGALYALRDLEHYCMGQLTAFASPGD